MKTLLQALSYARQLWPYYVGIIISSVLVAVAGIIIPFILKDATDLVVAAAQGDVVDSNRAILLAVLLLFFDVSRNIIKNIGGYWGDVMATKLRKELSVRYYEHLLLLPQSYFDQEMTGTIVSRLNRAISEVTQFLQAFANNFFQMLLTAIFTIIIVGFYSWQLAVLVVSIYPIVGWLTARTSKKWQEYQHQRNKEVDEASGRFAEVIAQARVVKSYVSEKIELDYFSTRFNKTIGINSLQSRYWHKMDTIRTTALSVIFFGIYAIIFTQTVQGEFTVGEMVLLITLLNTIRMPIFMMSYIVDEYQRALTGSYEFVNVMKTEPEASANTKLKALKVKKGHVVFDNVSFGYTDSVPVLDAVSFTIKPGEKLALVGESGQGKTTISNLLMRLYDPTHGRILIDDTDIADVSRDSLRKNIATVFQDPALFSGTIKENIAYGRSHASEDDIVRAAKAANADEFIRKLEDGYESVVGERGVKLSGGQKQRISIARALLKDAPILILDEATSSLDSRSEQLVQAALDHLMKGRTTLIIAHRLSTIADVDTIVTLKNGTVDEIGSPKKLATSGGIYSSLLKLQKGLDDTSKERLKSFDINN